MSKIKIVDGYKEYIKNKEKIIILNNINTQFQEGKLYGIVGKSGSGKSTLLNIIGTIDNFTTGKLIIDECEINTMKQNNIADLRMQKIGYIFQDFYLNENLTVEENILQPMYINTEYNKKKMKDNLKKLIDMIGWIEIFDK